MAAISQLVTNVVMAQIQSTVANGFNYWVNQLAGGSDYPNVPPFQILTSSDPQTLIQSAVDESVIDDAALFLTYPACVVRSVRGNANQFRYTPTSYSGPATIWVDMYSSILKDQVASGLSEQYHDLFLDAMNEAFNVQSELTLFAPDVVFNNDLDWSRGPLQEGGTDYRQKQRFVMSFSLPSVQSRSGDI